MDEIITLPELIKIWSPINLDGNALNELGLGPISLIEILFLAQPYSDDQGIEFISKTTSKVSLDTIQAFFRSFIYEEGRQSFSIQLSINELYASVPLPKEDLDLLIEMATSPEFRILNEHGTSLGFSIPQYLTDWLDLKRWISNEEKSYQQFRLFEEIAEEYFKGTGLLLGKERLAQALILKEEIFTTYAWEKKYNFDKELFYYNQEIHYAAFCLPNFIKNILKT